MYDWCLMAGETVNSCKTRVIFERLSVETKCYTNPRVLYIVENDE